MAQQEISDQSADDVTLFDKRGCEHEKGACLITESSASQSRGLYLLFAHGKRPDLGALRAFVARRREISLSFDPLSKQRVQLVSSDREKPPIPRPGKQSGDEPVWVELLRDGLAFDLIGMAPGRGQPYPAAKHRFDLNELPAADQFDALHLTPGHHLTGGERTMPVVKGLIGLARDLVRHFEDLNAVLWPPSSSAIGQRFFESTATAWLEGGPFPALGLTAFSETNDGALESEGLGFWIDQELRIEPPLSSDKVAATRIGMRLVNQLVLVGGIDGSERIIGPDGSRLVLRTSRNGRFIQVWSE